MPNLTLYLADELRGKTKDETEKVLDQEVELFSAFMADLPDPITRGALSRPERALLKTYLVHKLAGRIG